MSRIGYFNRMSKGVALDAIDIGLHKISWVHLDIDLYVFYKLQCAPARHFGSLQVYQNFPVSLVRSREISGVKMVTYPALSYLFGDVYWCFQV